jgi:hypothetical protein
MIERLKAVYRELQAIQQELACNAPNARDYPDYEACEKARKDHYENLGRLGEARGLIATVANKLQKG